MAIFAGKNGKVYWDAGGTDVAVLNISEWTVDIKCGEMEANIMGSDWTIAAASQKGWTATVNCYIDSTGFSIDTSVADAEGPLVVELWLQDEATEGLFTGSAIITDMSTTTPADGFATVNYQLKGTGAIAYATTTAVT